MQTLPYGSWPSNFSIEHTLASSRLFSCLKSDNESIYWLESLPNENGRVTLYELREGIVKEITAGLNIRSRVMEYGGGAYDVQAGRIVVCDDFSSQILAIEPKGVRTICSSASNVRYGGLRLVPDQNFIVAVRERQQDKTTLTDIVKISMFNGEETVLVDGADFYAGPTIYQQKLAWFEWHHPNMPWDESIVKIADLSDPINCSAITQGHNISAQHPVWLSDGRLLYADDSSGFWDLHIWPTQEIFSQKSDLDTPVWTLDPPLFTEMSPGLILVVKSDSGQQKLVLWEISGKAKELPIDISSVDSITSQNGLGFALVNWFDRPPSIIQIEADGSYLEIFGKSDPNEEASIPESIWFDGDAGPVQAWWYPPVNKQCKAPDNELPPVIVLSHGGPTGVSFPDYQKSVQFWTSRGIAILKVNYSGSVSFGRAYRNRLRGKWGILDVTDCQAAVTHLISLNMIDPNRVAIQGGSAGGYTTLESLVSSRMFRAGISLYGIGDLEMLALDTHKFESHYLDGLIGPYPEYKQRYFDLSPINHLDKLNAPMLILQGIEDKVVPPNQAESMAKAVREKGLPVSLIMFEGEGHGFRKSTTQQQVLAASLSFLGQIFRFNPADEIPKLNIENL